MAHEAPAHALGGGAPGDGAHLVGGDVRVRAVARGELAAAKRASAARAAEEGEDEDEDEGDDDSDSDSDKDLSDADSEERRAMFENARADAASPGFGLGDGWVEDDIVFDQFDHFDELAADDDGVVDIGAVMDLGFDE